LLAGYFLAGFGTVNLLDDVASKIHRLADDGGPDRVQGQGSCGPDLSSQRLLSAYPGSEKKRSGEASRDAHRLDRANGHGQHPLREWDPGRVSHNSYVRIGSASLFFTRDWYDRDIAALFPKADRYFQAGEDGECDSYGYQTTARQMRERLQARGFSAQMAWSGLASAGARWAEEPRDGRPPGSVKDEFQRYVRQLEDFPLDRVEEHLAALDQPFAFLVHLDRRDVLRLLLDRVPDDTVVALDLSELTGCCVEMDPDQPIAESARQEQLQRVALDSPLIVLTEGSTDSRLLSDGMEITHPTSAVSSTLSTSTGNIHASYAAERLWQRAAPPVPGPARWLRWFLLTCYSASEACHGRRVTSRGGPP
jgi:HEPN/Toprim N-terminal domain 1